MIRHRPSSPCRAKSVDRIPMRTLFLAYAVTNSAKRVTSALKAFRRSPFWKRLDCKCPSCEAVTGDYRNVDTVSSNSGIAAEARVRRSGSDSEKKNRATKDRHTSKRRMREVWRQRAEQPPTGYFVTLVGSSISAAGPSRSLAGSSSSDRDHQGVIVISSDSV